ncbi:MAG: indolepyruvate oxidoreductase subunit beta [Blautia sp.]|nr:indolepyruvate oxidoreductase subunit beta [Blautia sp.]
MNKDIMICGVGGQGTVLASKIIAASAMEEGNTVHSAETIGMAQRGGSVTSHVRIGDRAYSPLIPSGSADLILAFEPAEAVRNLKYLKKGGMAVVNRIPTKPVTESLHPSGYNGTEMIEYLQGKCDCIFVDADEVCASFGSTKFFNIIILGIAAGSGRLGIDKDTILAQIAKRVPARFADINRRAFLKGYEIGAGAA